VLVPLGQTDLALLLALVENAGALVAKKDLVSRVWRHAAVSDNALYVHINALRKIIGEDCIVNKQGRGYRFVAQVQHTRKSLPRRPDKPQTGNLPSLLSGNASEGLTRLIGRGEHLRVASRLLSRSRLVTVTGPGGVGKTKFAFHAAEKNTGRFPDGIWLVELDSLKESDLVTGATAAALGIEIGDNAKPLDTLARHLARRSLLLVLDNCEQVIAGAKALCEGILGAAPNVRILATSREALCCSGEQVFELPPLALPRDDVTAPEIIRETAAVELFVERAKSANANFRLTDEDAPVVARICRRVDGLPLAIEMIAGWADVLGLEALDAKFDGSIKNLLRARTSTPQRHSKLRDTLEWSHDLLSAEEQTVLRRLAVFAGSFNLQCAEAVAGGEDIPSSQIFEHLASLIRKSMIALVPGAPRYRLLETTRAFMLERLVASDEAEVVRRRHANHLLHLLEKATEEWEVISDASWLERYGPVLDDLRNALDWTTAREPDTAVALAGVSWLLWRELSLRAEGRRRLTLAAAQLHPKTPPALEARLRRGLGDMSMQSAPATAHAELTRAVILYRSQAEPSRLGSALSGLASSLFFLGRVEEARPTILEALNLLEQANWPKTLAAAYSIQLCIEALLGQHEAARAAGEKSVQLCERAGADRPAFVVLGNLLELSLQMNDVDTAITEGRSLAARLRDTSHSDVLGFVLGVLTAALTARSDLDEALTTAREAAPLLRDEGSLFWLFDHLALRSGLARRTTDAALLSGYADAIYKKTHYPREPMGHRAMERLRTLLQATLPNQDITRLGKLGSQLSEDQAMTLALSG
jgi:predicted ATPase